MNHIVLIGMRGAGKSFTGKKLAKVLSLPFIDLDTYIQDQEGMSIQDMVEQYGWEYFRKKESQSLLAMQNLPQSIIATGGGAILQKENQNILKKLGTIIWIHCDIETIIKRLEHSQESHRPRLSKTSIKEELITTYAKRKKIYEELADKILSSEKNAEQEIKKILKDIKK